MANIENKYYEGIWLNYKQSRFFEASNFFRKTTLSLCSALKLTTSISSDSPMVHGYIIIEKRLNFFVNSLFLYFYSRMTVQYKRIFASILFVLISFVCLAQGGDPPPPQPPPPPGLPIDMGIVFGIAAGIFFGIKKLLKIQN